MDRITLDQITKVYRFDINRSSWTRERSTNDHFIAYKLNGSSIHEQNGKTYPFRRDMLMVANKNDLYRVTQNEFAAAGRKGGCIAIHFTAKEPFNWHFSVFQCSGHPQIKSAFFKILDAWNQLNEGHPEAEYRCISRFYEICSYLFELKNRQFHEERNRLEEARDFMERNLSDCSLTIADAADIAHLSQRRFTELFAAKYRLTPGRYLTECRMKHAVELLDQCHLTISEIASLSGYADSSYFIRVFRKEVGTSPNAYRKQIE